MFECVHTFLHWKKCVFKKLLSKCMYQWCICMCYNNALTIIYGKKFLGYIYIYIWYGLIVNMVWPDMPDLA